MLFFLSFFFFLIILAPGMTLLEAMDGPPLVDAPFRCELRLVYRCPNLVIACRVWQALSMGERV